MSLKVGLALSHLHGCNIAHRDIKPVNILLSDNGEVAQLSDFGLATELNHPDHKESDTKAEVDFPASWCLLILFSFTHRLGHHTTPHLR
jgi:serine/threonine protein kinase